MLVIKDNTYIKHNMFIDDQSADICYFYIPILKVDYTSLIMSHCYMITTANRYPNCTIEIDKRTSDLVELKFKNNSTLCFALYFSFDNNISSVDIKMESSYILALDFDSFYRSMEWQRNASEYHITIDEFGYVYRIQRIYDGVKVSFNTDGSITTVN